MSWSPISLAVLQYSDTNGELYSGAVLKAYASGTSTPISMATDSTGGTTVGSVALNASGYPAVSGNVIIPHVSANYKLVLYPTQAAADANSGALWSVDALIPATTNLAASTGSSLVGHIAAGTGAVATTSQRKLRERKSLFDSMTPAEIADVQANTAAVDVTAAMQATINKGGRIEVPDGTYLHGELTLVSNLKLVGENRGSVKFRSKPTIGTGNQLIGQTLDNVSISGIRFEGQNTTIAPTAPALVAALTENQIYLKSCTNVDIFDCAFDGARMRVCFMDATVGAPNINVFFHDNVLTNGSAGGFQSARYNQNVHVYNNRVTDIVDSAYGGSAFDKPLAVNGVLGVWIYNNEITQTNGEGGPILVEYMNRESQDIHVYDNRIINGADSGIKIGPCFGGKVYDNYIRGNLGHGVYVEGCTDLDVHDNHIENSALNSIRLAEDGDTAATPTNIRVYRNKLINANTAAASIGDLAVLAWTTGTAVALGEVRSNAGRIYTAVAAGTTGATAPTHTSGSVSDGTVTWTDKGVPSNTDASFHIFVRGDSFNCSFEDNEFSSTGTNLCNGIKVGGGQSNYWIERNDFRKLRNGVTTILNGGTTLPYVVDNNRGAQNRSSGIATIASGASAVTVNGDYIYEGTGVSVVVTPAQAMTGAAVYLTAELDALPTFIITARNTSHAPTNTSAALLVNWQLNIVAANGYFGKTVR